MSPVLPVTVIVPVHNGRETLPATLDSIRRQTGLPESVIVVDDASTDGSAELARESDVPGLRVVSLQVNRGVGAARNAGARRAATQWLAFLDADDVWDPAFLKTMIDALGETMTHFATSGGIRERYYPRRLTYRRLLDEPPGASDRSADFWRISFRQWASSPSATVVQRELFERVGGFPEDMKTAEDITLFSRLWLDGRFCFVNLTLYTSVQRPTGLTAQGLRYRDVLLVLGRVGRCLLEALARRKPGTGWFVLTYARMVVGRHRAWFEHRLRTRVGLAS